MLSQQSFSSSLGPTSLMSLSGEVMLKISFPDEIFAFNHGLYLIHQHARDFVLTKICYAGSQFFGNVTYPKEVGSLISKTCLEIFLCPKRHMGGQQGFLSFVNLSRNSFYNC